jgi:hypothetical protein
MTTAHRFPIGTRYLSAGKFPRECVVSDHLTTTNAAGDVVSRLYVTTHQFLGQTVSETNVCDTTIARGVTRLQGEPA